MTSGRAGGRSVRAGTTAAGEKKTVEPFRTVLETEEHRLAEVARPEDLTGWQSRVIREVMDRRSAYAQALRRDHGTCCQNEFLHAWQSLLTSMLQLITPTTAPATTTRTEDVATAILAALHGGATLSWLADDPRPLEAALDIALAPVLSPQRASGSGVRPPR